MIFKFKGFKGIYPLMDKLWRKLMKAWMKWWLLLKTFKLSRKFKLGAKVVESTSSRASIKEGTSEPFVIKDNRGESYKKHYPPYLNDDIRRLEKIAKDEKIHKRLSSHGILMCVAAFQLSHGQQLLAMPRLV
ncbi:calmodulin-binding protein 60 B [Arachis duranensis]|uniref:Calmodulin-binding protein 60 B n=1 Tax=Arachis duranensis TaxID=130453 RepID=A0A9C6TSF5_ARADU|nr:calmodulin-binding protein 60 B [Arachis duranensis]